MRNYEINGNELTIDDYRIVYHSNDTVTVYCRHTGEIVATHEFDSSDKYYDRTAQALRFVRELIGDDGTISHEFSRSLFVHYAWN